MKKSVVFFIIILIIIPSLLAFSWGNFFKGITGKASASSTNVSIQVIVPLPNLTILHPQNTTYSDNSSLSLNFTSQYAVSLWYHIDNNANVTITGNTTFNVSEGGHILFLYANNTDKNTSRVNVSFNINASAVSEESGSGSSGGGGGSSKKPSSIKSDEPKEETPEIKGPEKEEEAEEEPQLETPQQKSCKGWSECQADYTLEDMIAENILLTGKKFCLDDHSIKISCNSKKEISVKKSEKCFTEYYEIYDQDNKLISKLEIKTEDIKIVNIDFTLGNSDYCGYCYDNKKNFDEENIDCGGSCAPCIEIAKEITPSIKNIFEFRFKYCEFPYLLAVLLAVNVIILLKFIRFNFYKNILLRRMHFFAGHIESKENFMRMIGIMVSSLMMVLSITFLVLLSSCWFYYVLFLLISLILFLIYNIEKLKILIRKN